MRKRPEPVNQGASTSISTDDQVHLPPVLGIRPGVYLSVIYGLVFLGLLFFLCLFPGLSRPGSLVSFTTEPEGAAIRIDGVNRGAAPEELFLDRGPHTVEFVLPGFKPRFLELEVPGQAAFSLFFPRRLELREVLATDDPLAALIAAAVDYTAWSFTGEATASYQIPLSLSEGVYRVGPLLDANEREEAAEIIRAAARFAVSQASLRDLGRAKTLLDNGGLVPSALSLSRSAVDIAVWLSSAPGAAAWLGELLPTESGALVRDSAWARGAGQAAPPAQTEPADQTARTGARALEIAGLRFLPAPETTGGGGFYYAEQPAGADLWERFLEDRPEWGLENLETLREQKLVNGDYLAGPAEEGAPLTGVSWYAAVSFCEWLGARLPPGFEGWEIRLPREDEWESCFPAAGSALWEWCDDPYGPLRRFPAERGAIERLSSPERVLRAAQRPDSRGSLPPDLCSPFVGFRPFIVPKG
ncbi:MAG: SUMF1/EgtB/PvdO family nonheme iron enzyme [Treponema sp.]|nr:SUMF1/EgtB/PvdO family nonheme iron enzyme [Treponema sp.]